MAVRDLLTTPEGIEKIVSDIEVFKSILDLDDESPNLTGIQEASAINFVLCDVVIENVFSAYTETNKDLEKYDRITIYFKPLCENNHKSMLDKTDKEQSCLRSILTLLNVEKVNKQKLLDSFCQIENIRKQLELKEKQKAIIETKISSCTNIIITIRKKTINRRIIFLNRNLIRKLQQELLEVNKQAEYIEQQLIELQQNRAVLEGNINKNINDIIDILFENYSIEKIDCI